MSKDEKAFAKTAHRIVQQSKGKITMTEARSELAKHLQRAENQRRESK